MNTTRTLTTTTTTTATAAAEYDAAVAAQVTAGARYAEAAKALRVDNPTAAARLAYNEANDALTAAEYRTAAARAAR